MKPGFALSLSFEGISLLHRAAGGWRTVGDVAIESTDLGAALADLRDKAARLSPNDLACKLIIPNDQIRYLTIETGSAEDGLRTEMVLAALDGATPYPVSDLAFDISIEGEMTHIAAVARETLAEAEAFAVEHLFNPVSFVAIPGDNLYLGEANFGPTSHAADFLGGTRAESDHVAVVIIGMADVPENAPDPEPTPESELPIAGFASRRRKTPDPVLLLETLADVPVEPTPEPTLKVPTPVSPPIPTPIAAPAAADIDMPEPAVTAPSLAGATRHHDAPNQDLNDQDLSDDSTLGAPAVAVPVPIPTTTFSDLKPRPKVEIPEKKAGFLNRHRDKTPAVAAAAMHRVAPVDIPADVSTDEASDEAQRMTVFGARTDPDVGGKPRYLGLVLTATLLLFLAGIAAWASLFMDTKLSRWLFLDPADYELAAEPEPGQELPIAVDTQAVVAPLSAADNDEPVLAALPPTEPDLSDTDAAVLDALRETDQTAEIEIEAVEIEATSAHDSQQGLETPAIIGLDDLYIASIDRTDLSHDAVALPSLASQQTDVMPGSINSPVAAGTEFTLDERGLVTPTINGTVNPDGVIVYLGQLPSRPPPTPPRDDPEAEQQDVQNYLATLRPLARPDDLMELAERAKLGGLTHAELGRVRPLMRPERPVIAEVVPEPETATTGTKLAVAVSVKPLARPKGLVNKSRNANLGSVAAITQTATIAPRTVKPSIPSSASVARQATLDNAINLRKINLIGVYGTKANRRALVRLPSGRYKKVQIGDRIDGGQVLAISDSELRYQKGGRNMTLKIPNG